MRRKKPKTIYTFYVAGWAFLSSTEKVSEDNFDHPFLSKSNPGKVVTSKKYGCVHEDIEKHINRMAEGED